MQMAYFICTDPIKAADAMDRMSAEAHWYYTKNKQSVYTPNREILQGMGEATKYPIMDKDEYVEYDIEDAYNAFMSGEIKVNEPVCIDHKVTSIGRAWMSEILEADIDQIIGDDFINAGNIAKIMTFIQPQGPDKLLEMQKFSIEVLKHKGITTLTLQDLYVNTNKYASEFEDIINSDDSYEDKDYKLTKALGKVMNQVLDDLPVPDIRKTIRESNRYRTEQLTSLVGPVIVNNGDSFEVELTSHVDGVGTKAYIEECINNRVIWGYKQSMVTVGGYNARQLAMSARAITFEPAENTNDNEPIYLPADEEEFLSHREVIGESPIPGYVAVRSCIFNGENKVYSNEIDSSIYRTNAGDLHSFNIGIDMMQSFSETATQSALGLKHGGAEWHYTEECYKMKQEGILKGIVDEFAIVEINGEEKKFLLPNSYSITENKELKVGDVLFESKSCEHVTAPLAKISKFLDSITLLEELQNAELTDCYSWTEGNIHYVPTSGYCEIGGVRYQLNRNNIYYYPEGTFIKKFQRFCSGVLNANRVYNITKDPKITFILFRKQLHKLNGKLNLDIAEVLFKSIYQKGFSIKKSLNTSADLIGTLYKGSPKGNKQIIKEFVNTEMKLFDEDDLLYKLIFSDGLNK